MACRHLDVLLVREHLVDLFLEAAHVRHDLDIQHGRYLPVDTPERGIGGPRNFTDEIDLAGREDRHVGVLRRRQGELLDGRRALDNDRLAHREGHLLGGGSVESDLLLTRRRCGTEKNKTEQDTAQNRDYISVGSFYTASSLTPPVKFHFADLVALDQFHREPSVVPRGRHAARLFLSFPGSAPA